MRKPLTATQPPFFIIGVERSGTSLLRLMLDNHSRIAVPFESHFIPLIHRRLSEFGDLSRCENASRLLGEIRQDEFVIAGGLIPDAEAVLAHPVRCYRDLIDAIFSEHAHREGKLRWGDKTPAYIEALDVLNGLFPETLFIHIVRDGRDVALSHRRLKWQVHLPTIAARWQRQALSAHRFGRLLKGRYLEIRYEALAISPVSVLKQVCTFLEEPYDPAMLDYFQRPAEQVPERATPWHPRLAEPPDASQVESWKRNMSQADRIIFEQIAGGALACFGYELENHPDTQGSLLKGLYYWTMDQWRRSALYPLVRRNTPKA